MAESPPPMTATAWSWKNMPSQVAQWETPRPSSSDSPGTPSFRCSPPAAMITVLASQRSPSPSSSMGCLEASMAVTAPKPYSRPALLACSSAPVMRSMPETPLGKPG